MKLEWHFAKLRQRKANVPERSCRISLYPGQDENPIHSKGNSYAPRSEHTARAWRSLPGRAYPLAMAKLRLA
jgi:hypothetical protein